MSRIISFPICAIILLCCAATSYAQFSGLVILGANHSTNVTGTDTSSGDIIYTPAISLQYKIPFSKLFSLTVQGDASPSIYTETPDLSYNKYHLSAIGKWYLSENPVVYPVDNSVQLQSHSSTSSSKPKSDSSKVTKKPTQSLTFEDSVKQVANSLAALSQRLDALSVGNKSSIKDSLSESLSAIAEILSEESYTESVRSVVIDELAADEALLSQMPIALPLKDSVAKILRNTKRVLDRGNSQADLFPVPEPAIEDGEDETPNNTSVLTASHLQTRFAPIITLVDASTDLWEFGSLDISTKEELYWRTPLTLGTLLTIPVEFSQQTNRDIYKEFTYSQFEFTPRLTFYPADNIGLGVMYNFSSNYYPNDSLFTYREHRFRVDATFGIGSSWVIGIQGGISLRDYPHPRSDTVRVVRLIVTKGTENFSQEQFGLTSTFLLSQNLSIGFGGAVTRSTELRSYLIDARLGRSPVGGKASDDEFSYKLSKGFLYLTSNIFWDLDLSIDLSYEERLYGTGVNRKLNQNLESKLTRTDHGTAVSAELSRDFYFDEPWLSIFDAFTPQLGVQYQNYTSTIALFTYNDLAISLSVSALF